MLSLRRLLAGLFLFAATGAGSPSLTPLRDVLFRADGTPLTGVVVITWPAFTAADGTIVAANTMKVDVRNGTFRVDLIPTTNAQTAARYSVQIVSDGKDQTRETWSIPPSPAPLTIQAVLVSSSPGGVIPPPDISSGIKIGDVQGLSNELASRAVTGPGYATSRAAIIDPNGALSAAAGDPADCVRVNGTSGPCGSGGNSSSASFVDAEIPAGIVDGANAQFSLSKAPNPRSSLSLARNGLVLQQGTDYTLSGNTVAFQASTVPQAGDVLQVSYRAGNPTSGGTTATTGVFSDTDNAFGHYTQDFSASAALIVRSSAGAAPTAAASLAYDQTSGHLKHGNGTATRTLSTLEDNETITGAKTWSAASTFNGSITSNAANTFGGAQAFNGNTTFGAATHDFSGASALLVRSGARLAPTAAASFGYDSTSGFLVYGNGLPRTVGNLEDPQTYSGVKTFTPQTIFTTGTTSPLYTAAGAMAIRPGTDSTTAIQFQTSGGAATILNLDTSNQRFGIGNSAPGYLWHLYNSTAGGSTTGVVQAGATQGSNDLFTFFANDGSTKYWQLNSSGYVFMRPGTAQAHQGSYGATVPQGYSMNSSWASGQNLNTPDFYISRSDASTLANANCKSGYLDACTAPVARIDMTNTSTTTTNTQTGLAINGWGYAPATTSNSGNGVIGVGVGLADAATPNNIRLAAMNPNVVTNGNATGLMPNGFSPVVEGVESDVTNAMGVDCVYNGYAGKVCLGFSAIAAGPNNSTTAYSSGAASSAGPGVGWLSGFTSFSVQNVGFLAGKANNVNTHVGFQAANTGEYGMVVGSATVAYPKATPEALGNPATYGILLDATASAANANSNSVAWRSLIGSVNDDWAARSIAASATLNFAHNGSDRVFYGDNSLAIGGPANSGENFHIQSPGALTPMVFAMVGGRTWQAISDSSTNSSQFKIRDASMSQDRLTISSTGAVQVAQSFGVTGATTLSSTLGVTGAATFSADVTHNQLAHFLNFAGSLDATDTHSVIYGTTSGGSFPFNLGGGLVLQSRATGAATPIVFVTGNSSIATPVHSVGTGLSDISRGGAYTSPLSKTFCIRVQTAATPDTFEWDTAGCTTFAGGTNVAITGAAQTLSDGVTITWGATTGHMAGDQWTIVATPPNLPIVAAGNGKVGIGGVTVPAQALDVQGNVALRGLTSGMVTLQTQAASGTYNFNLPITAGSGGQVLRSQGGGATAMDWLTLAPSATTDTSNASNISSGMLPNARLSAVPNSALANASVTINGTANQITVGGGSTLALGGTATLSLPSLVSVTSLSTAVNSVTFSATPTFNAALGNVQTINLTANVTSSSISNAVAGQELSMLICQDATGGRTFAWPANVHGAVTIGATPSLCNAQNFVYSGSAWYALSPGVVNQ